MMSSADASEFRSGRNGGSETMCGRFVFQVAVGEGHQRARGARAGAGRRRHRPPQRGRARTAQVRWLMVEFTTICTSMSTDG